MAAENFSRPRKPNWPSGDHSGPTRTRQVHSNLLLDAAGGARFQACSWTHSKFSIRFRSRGQHGTPPGNQIQQRPQRYFFPICITSCGRWSLANQQNSKHPAACILIHSRSCGRGSMLLSDNSPNIQPHLCLSIQFKPGRESRRSSNQFQKRPARVTLFPFDSDLVTGRVPIPRPLARSYLFI